MAEGHSTIQQRLTELNPQKLKCLSFVKALSYTHTYTMLMFGHSFYVYKIKLQPACIYTYIVHLLLPRLYIHASKSFEKSICHMT